MAPNCRSPLGTHYAHVDDWKDDAKGEDHVEGGAPRGDSFTAPTPVSLSPYVSPGDSNTCEMRAREPRIRNCCRTNHEIPYGSHFPIEETLDSVGEWRPTAKPVNHLEYGYQATWRPSRTVIPIKDLIEPCVITPSNVEFRPSIKYINSGTGAWSERWKASKRYIPSGRGKDYQWRSSVGTSHPHKTGHEVVYRPQVRPDPANSSLETNEGHFKPTRRYLPPYTPLKQKPPYQSKRHIIFPPEWVPPFRIQGEDHNSAPPKPFGKARVLDYAASHPPLCLAWDAATPPGSVPSATDRPGSPSAYVGHGATPFACGPNGLPRSTRRYIPSGHLSHFENNNCCICKVGVGDSERKPLRKRTASGPYHDTVPDRNPIAGHMPETDVYREPRVCRGPAPFGPAGSINSDIIDHKFSDLLQKRTPVSEMKDQYRKWELSKDVC